MTEICQLYLLTPPVIEDVPAFCETLKETLAAAPVACLQIRLKDLESSALIQAGTAITKVCHAAGVEVILNDRPDLVAKIGADGAHIGQDDMDYFSSREVLGGDAIIGVTCHNSKELAFAAAKAGADYVAFGAFFETPTKTPKTRAEVEILSWWHEAVEIPSVAIGGITVDNAKTLIAAGADFIAVSSGVWSHPHGPVAAVSRLSQLCAEHSPRSVSP
jgi:thiamine-phosphate pyrophosphorylase